MSVYMHDKWPLIYESILPNCKCFVTVYEGFCGQDGRKKQLYKCLHQRIGLRCEWHTKTLGC